MPAVLSLSRRVAAWPVLWLTVASLACLAPFVNKAFHIDDTLFLYAARHIQTNPIDFYGFHINWYGTEMPMGGEIDEAGEPVAGVMQNPPLASYYIALAAGVLGWSEPALHLAFLLPAVAVVWGTYRLAQRLCCKKGPDPLSSRGQTPFCNTRPVLAALATLLTPAFLVSSTNVMCDTLTLAFWVWAIVLWERGLGGRQMALLFAGAVLICLAALSKYIGVALIPLLVVYTAIYQWKQSNWLMNVVTPCLFLAIPLAVMFAYQEFTEGVYGRGLLFQAVGYAASVKQSGGHFLLEILSGFCFLGGGVASVLFFAPLLWSWRQLLIGLGLAAVILLVLGQTFLLKGDTSSFSFGQPAATEPRTTDTPRPNTVPWLGILQFALFTAAGLSLLLLTGVDVWRRRDAGSWLLALWVGGIFVFATIFNWTLNMRSLLPLLPAAGILIARRLEERFGRHSVVGLSPRVVVRSPSAAVVRSPDRTTGPTAGLPARAWAALAWPLVPAAILAVLVTYADYRLAGSSREAAFDIVTASAEHPGTLWFQGHWGFQYYMEGAGARPVEFKQFLGKPGDLIVYPLNNTNVDLGIPAVPKRPWKRMDLPSCPWLASFDPSVGASFYASIWGPLPFAFGKVKAAPYLIFEVGRANPPGSSG